jgi:hypothetical protein
VGIEISDRSGNNTIYHNEIKNVDYGIYLLEPGPHNKVLSNNLKNASIYWEANIE